MIDPTNPIIVLCVSGSRAEFEGQPADARRLYAEAWAAARDDYEACIAAHYVARFQPDPHETLRWNQVALDRSNLSGDERVRDFYPSLYVNLGRAHEQMKTGRD